MATTAASITVEDLAKKLKDVFSAENKINKKYAEVWLSDADFGGLYYSGKVIVHLVAEHELESRHEEMKYIGIELFKLLSKEERSFIWRLVVHNPSENMYCESDELPVYSIMEECR